ncbi:MAG: hypothetical protein WDO24_25135 [Pseudomonadota bacterium]
MLNLDHCFAGWDGRAEIAWPELGLQLTMTADPRFGHCVIAVLPSADAPEAVVAIEPVSHANNAINLQDDGDPGHGLVSDRARRDDRRPGAICAILTR